MAARRAGEEFAAVIKTSPELVARDKAMVRMLNEPRHVNLTTVAKDLDSKFSCARQCLKRRSERREVRGVFGYLAHQHVRAIRVLESVWLLAIEAPNIPIAAHFNFPRSRSVRASSTFTRSAGSAGNCTDCAACTCCTTTSGVFFAQRLP